MRRSIEILLMLLLLVSCQKEDFSLTISNRNIKMSEEILQTTTNIIANCEWSITGVPSWLEVTPQRGNSDAQIHISLVEGLHPSEVTMVSLIVESKKGNDFIYLLYYPEGVIPDLVPKNDNFRKYKKDIDNDDNDVVFEGRVDILQKSKHDNPVNIIVLGDGFISEDNVPGGNFSNLAQEAVEGIFSIPPYSSYRDWFSVTAIAINSPERGATVKNQSYVNTIFQTEIEGGNSTGISCNYARVFRAVTEFTSFDESVIENSMIILIVNKDIYAGTCIMYSTGESIAMVPVDRSSTDSFIKIVLHEAGGHGFGKLADEYVYYPNQRVSRNDVYEHTLWMDMGGVNSFYQNISFSDDPAQAGWATFIGRDRYENVGLYQGAIYYGLGVWRCEMFSSMDDNRKYFNVASRYAIYKRIMTTAKMNYSVDDFVAYDLITSDPTPVQGAAHNVKGYVFRPLAPPILVK